MLTVLHTETQFLRSLTAEDVVLVLVSMEVLALGLGIVLSRNGYQQVVISKKTLYDGKQ